MKEINIGIIGGCLATNAFVKKSELFYNRIASCFRDTHRIHYSLGSYNNLSEIINEITRLKNCKNIKYLLLQIRPYVYLKNCRFYLNLPNKGTINPLAFSKNFKAIEQFETKLTRPLHTYIAESMENKTNSFVKKYLSFYNLNLMFGYIFRINKLMEEYYISKIEEIGKLCAEEGITLIIHGPVARTTHEMEMILLNSLATKLKKNIRDSTYVSTVEPEFADNSILHIDGAHVNAHGHKMLSEKLICALKNNGF